MKAYLGDGAYVATGCYRGELVLTTEDGVRATNTIVLGPHEFCMLVDFVKAAEEFKHQPDTED